MSYIQESSRKVGRTEQQADEIIDKCLDQVGLAGPRDPDRTYEEGVIDAIKWMQGSNDIDEWPFTEFPRAADGH